MSLLGLIMTVGIILISMHFIAPSTYYVMAIRWLKLGNEVRRPTELGGDPPFVSVIVPTYNEARMIVQKLNNIYSQDYPRDRLEIIIVDSKSIDETVELVREWARAHGDVSIRVIEEGARLGKVHALNTALRHAKGDVIVITDADSVWMPDSLRNAIAWLMSDGVGAVSCYKVPRTNKGIETRYRDYYGILRLAESRRFSSAIFHGELAAFRRELLERVGGFPMDIGADDSYTAGLISMMGYRAIIPDDVRCIEYVPSRGYWMWRVRRAQHLIQHFSRVLRRIILSGRGVPREYREIMLYESYLHLINPWLFIIGLALLVVSAIHGALIPIVLLLLGLVLLPIGLFRTWVVTQFMLVVAAVRNIWNKELVWRKIEK